MDVGIALPNAVPGAPGAQLTEWARRAEARGFSTLGTIDRVVYDNYEPLIALAAAAAVTERIGLSTTVLLAPLRTNAVLLAKQALSVNALSDGRLTLGVGLGARDDDYEIGGVELSGRGERLDAMLGEMERIWDGGEVGPPLAGAPRLIVGGHADASYARAARFADGWIASGTGPEVAREGIEKAKAAWADAGREGRPHLMALAYFSLGERAEEDVRENLMDYYAWLGGGGGRHDRRRRRQGRRGGQAGCRGLRGGWLRRAGLLPQLRRPGPGRPAGRRGRTLTEGHGDFPVI
jgi:alkanesulfonate monooxygenase SsuD/methylene tetrahydromethanopterin reductase-like flavin-dependent oxidoreductase (luciferase family)